MPNLAAFRGIYRFKESHLSMESQTHPWQYFDLPGTVAEIFGSVAKLVGKF
jgi:hypothetical protein